MQELSVQQGVEFACRVMVKLLNPEVAGTQILSFRLPALLIKLEGGLVPKLLSRIE